MDKKTIKAILDVIKDVKDRPPLWGAEIRDEYIYFTDGYLIVRLTMGEYTRKFPPMWVGGEQLNKVYKNMTAKDICTELSDDGDLDGSDHFDLSRLWERYTDIKPATTAAIDPTKFKKLVPFGLLGMRPAQTPFGKIVQFRGRGVEAFVCPLNTDKEKELCVFQSSKCGCMSLSPRIL